MYLLTILVGMIANFIGYIPPGNINLTLTRLTIVRGMQQALRFIISFSIVEFFFTLFIMHAARWISQQAHLETLIDWVMAILFTILAIVTWRSRNHPPETKYSEQASIRYGIILGIVNPMQIPFWMVAGTYVISHHWISSGPLALILFSLGSAAGAFLCLLAYAKSAQYIQERFALSTKVINTAIAILFAAFAAYHFIKQIAHLL